MIIIKQFEKVQTIENFNNVVDIKEEILSDLNNSYHEKYNENIM